MLQYIKVPQEVVDKCAFGADQGLMPILQLYDG